MEGLETALLEVKEFESGKKSASVELFVIFNLSGRPKQLDKTPNQ